MERSTTRILLVLLLTAGLAACASVPPPESELGQADLALRKAEQADAAHFAPLEMRVARTKLEAARLAMRDEDNLAGAATGRAGQAGRPARRGHRPDGTAPGGC